MSRALPSRAAARFALLLSLSACARDGGKPGGGGSARASASAAPSQPPGMVWVPEGVLLAGTPKNVYPRVADAEMAGEQVVVHGFWIDEYPHPNEPGAIPTTNVTRAEAEALCAEQGKRLCAELELERACKGPNNSAFEYGPSFRPEVCGMGAGAPSLQPSGLRPACASAFGVHDLHGTAATWTSSAWRRGEPERPDLFAVRGGGGAEGELVGRCAHVVARPAGSKRPDTGVRCCFGEPNAFEVVLPVTRGNPFELVRPADGLVRALEQRAKEELSRAGGTGGEGWAVRHTWLWRPIGNEVVAVGGGCVEERGKKRKKRHAKPGTCLLLFARASASPAGRAPGGGASNQAAPEPSPLGPVTFLSVVTTGDWEPNVSEAGAPRSLWVVGADSKGAFRVTVEYAWGTLRVSPPARKTRGGRGRDGVFPGEQR